MAGGIPTGDELRKVLHRERSIELLMEGMRYHDLRRWKEAGEAMSRRPKAWNLDGRTAADFYRVSPMKESGVRIPQDLLDGHSVERNQYQLQPRAESRLLTLIIRLR